MDSQGYTPQPEVPAFNLTIHELRRSIRMLRHWGYSCHRYRDEDGGHDCNDWSVLVERTDGKTEAEILKQWKRQPDQRRP
jgi:hypothetical protein